MPSSLPNPDGDNETADLKIRMFGSLAVHIGDRPLPPLRTRKVYWLLALLVLRQERPVDRAWLAATLWPDSDHAESLRNLRDSLYDLRKALGGQAKRLHSPTSGTLVLDLAGADVDLLAFQTLTTRADAVSLARAVGLYSGMLLEGCHEEWVVGERERCLQLCLDALEALAVLSSAEGEFLLAAQHLRSCVRLDPLRETAQQRLMVALETLGDYAGAMHAYREFRLYLHDALQSSPAAETTALYEQIRVRARQRAAHTPATSAPSPPAGNAHASAENLFLPTRLSLTTPHNLPRTLTSFIGREREIEQGCALLQSKPLLTLTGVGGIGKTRVALEIAARLRTDFPDGVWLVEMDSLTEPDLVVEAVADVLCLREQPGAPLLQTLADRLMNRRLLLVLDNCEHLLDAVRQMVSALLLSCSGVRLLVTSRERLGIAGEQTYSLPSLVLPDLSAPATRERIEQTEAVRLFVERASLARPEFALNSQNAEVIAALCRRLDGMPLAIEFAAARLSVLSVEEIHHKLDDRFRLLTGGSKMALPRQQTLAAAMAWSYDLLSRPESILLDRLSVFLGGWTLEAAEAVGGGETMQGGGCIDDWEVLDLLSSLVDKSLVIAEVTAARTRYRLLETVRQYARDRLVRRGDRRIVRARHRDYFLNLVEANRIKLAGPEQGEWLKTLETEHDNLRLALRFCLEEPTGGEAGLRMGAALWWFWSIHGHVREGREQLRALLANPNGQDATKARADALNGAGSLAQEMCDYAAARSLLEESLALWRQLGGKLGSANALNNLGSVALFQNDFLRARSLYEEALALYRELGHKGSIADTLNNLGAVAADLGDHAPAYTLYAESLTMQRELGHKLGTAHALDNMGRVALKRSDFDLALSLHEESLAIYQELDNRSGIASVLTSLADICVERREYEPALSLYEKGLSILRDLGERSNAAKSLNSMGFVLCLTGDYASARERVKEALEIYTELGSQAGITVSLERFAILAGREGRNDLAVPLWGAVVAAHERLGKTLAPEDQQFMEQEIETVRAQMSAEAFAQLWSLGSALTLEQAVACALRKSVE